MPHLATLLAFLLAGTCRTSAEDDLLSDSCQEQTCRVTCSLMPVCLSDKGLRMRADSARAADASFNLTGGEVLRVAAVNMSRGHPQLELDSDGKVRFVPMSPFGLIVEALSQRIGVDYEIQIAESYGVATNEDDGEEEPVFDGMVGMLQQGEADIGAGFFTVMEERTRAVEYSRFLGDDEYTILMKTPNHFSKADSLIAPFSNEVWLVILLSSILMGPILWIFINYLQPLARKDAPPSPAKPKPGADSDADHWDKDDNRTLSLMMCYWFVYGALLKQGFTSDPKSDCTRILFAFWWIFIQVVTSFYTAELTAVLTLSKTELPINSLEELSKSNDAKWVGRDVAQMKLLSDSKLYGFLGDQIESGKGELVPDVYTAVDRVMEDENTYFIVERSVAENIIFEDFMKKLAISKEKGESIEGCKMTYARDVAFGSLPYGFILSKGNPGLREELNKVIDDLLAGDLIGHLNRRNLPASDLINDVCAFVDDKVLVVKDLISTFMVIVAGFGISTLFLTFEVLFPKSRMSNNSSNNGEQQQQKGDIDWSNYTMRTRDYYTANPKVASDEGDAKGGAQSGRRSININGRISRVVASSNSSRK